MPKIKQNHILFNFYTTFFNKIQGQQFNNWYFQAYNGITFNYGPPQFLPGGQLQSWFSCATISDKFGNLLFSSEGRNVFDKNNNIMPNGIGLLGDLCQINGLLIIPFINDTSKYYIFTAQGLSNFVANSQSNLQYSYSIVDMKQNGGLGDVVSKNNFIRFFSTEKMTAIPHANGNDIWWICRDWTNNFYSYKITCQGFQNNNPVISTVGNNVNNTYSLLSAGDIKASPDGRKICVVYGSYFEIYQFNNNTGKLSNPIKIETNGSYSSYGVEFSPNSKLLYVTQVTNPIPLPFTGIAQYNLSNYDSASIANSMVDVSSIENPFGFGLVMGLQLGPDGKIYHVRSGVSIIDVINHPNDLGVSCNFKDSILILPNPAYRRLPYSYVNLITNQNVQIPTYTVASDCRTVTLTGKTYIKGNNLTFKWKFGDGDSTIQTVTSGGDTTFTTVTHLYPVGIDTFNVQIYVTSDTVCGQGSAGKKVILPVKYFGEARFGVQPICGSLQVNFYDSSKFSNNNSAAFNYQWQFLNKNNIVLGTAIQPNTSFVYPNYDTVKARLILTPNILSNCSKADTLEKVFVLTSKPTAAFSNGLICLGKQVDFLNESTNAVGAIITTDWFINNTLASNNSNVFNYTFNQLGNYQLALKVATANGCSDTTTKNIVVAPAIANAGNDTIVREGETFVLNGSGGVSYVWQPTTGLDDITKSNPVGILNNSQRYTVKITTAQGCVGFDTVLITVLRNLKIPNAFSPNGDGIHETWEIEQLKDYPNASVQLFNKNGQLVYTAKGNSIAAWNGMMNNKPVPVGVYYYVIALNSPLYSKPYSGWVMVVK